MVLNVIAAADGLVGDGATLYDVTIVGIRSSLFDDVLVCCAKPFCDIDNPVAFLTSHLR